MAIAVKVPKHLQPKPIRSKLRPKPTPVLVLEDHSLVIHQWPTTSSRNVEKLKKPIKEPTLGEYRGNSRDPKVKARNKKIAQAYVDGLTMKQCVDKFKVPLGSVRHALASYGVEPRDRSYRTNG